MADQKKTIAIEGEGPDIVALQPLGNYQYPALPADEKVGRFFTGFLALFRLDEDAPAMADADLGRATLEELDAIAAPPACGPALDEIGLTVCEWLADDSARSIMAIVVPPCDENDVLATWARDNGHDVLSPPTRQSIMDPIRTPIPDLEGDGLLVVPQLETWFVRHRNGLVPVRDLLAAIDATERRCLVGCNSWAWAFLKKAVDSDMVLPTPLTFEAFGEKRLRQWFEGLAVGDRVRQVSFCLSKSGADVFELSGEDSPKNDYFQKLAAHSLGIPWIAWHIWRRSLRHDREEGDTEAVEGETETGIRAPETLWITGFEELSLPSQHRQSALLVLHALLIHGALTAQTLRLVVPLVGESNIVSALLTAGFVEREGDTVRSRPAAYPTVRAALASAGFPMDTL